jgi:protease-4
MYYPPAPPHKGSFARAIFMTLATSIFGLSIALNVYLLILSGFAGGAESPRRTTILSGDPRQTVAVVPVNGLIDDDAVNRFERAIRTIEADQDIKALVLEVDTPGGTVTASDQIYHRILRLKQDRKLPVVVAMGSLATSGGYYLSCAADEIVAQRTTITGNIGVLLPRYNLSKLAEKHGIEDTSLASTGATFKNAGSMLKPETPEERAYWLGLIDDAFATFKQVVASGRSAKLKAPMEEVANGKAYTASQSLQMGLVDYVDYPSFAYDRAAALAGLTNKHVVRFETRPTLLESLGLGASLKAANNLTINGVNINLDKAWLEELMTPRPMYLWRGQ